MVSDGVNMNCEIEKVENKQSVASCEFYQHW